MGAIIGGLIVAGIGAGVSAYGTAQNAAATEEQAALNAIAEKKFGEEWSAKAGQLEASKLDKLYNIGNIFDRFEGAGAFGDTDVLKNLRKAQEDFSLLAAGDFTGFESQLRNIMQDNLIATFGSGAPVGTYTQLSADSVMNLRRTGMAEASAATGFLSGLHNELLGLEFGVLDQSFDRKYGIARQQLSAITGYGSQAAATQGVGTQAAGGALTSIGSSLATYGMFQSNQQNANLNAQVAAAPRAADIYTGLPIPYGQYGALPAGYGALPSVSPTYSNRVASSGGGGYNGPQAPDPYPNGGYIPYNAVAPARTYMPFLDNIPGINPNVNFTNSYFDTLIGSGEDIVGGVLPELE